MNKKILGILMMMSLLLVNLVSAYNVYDLRTPDTYLVYGNHWDNVDRLDCRDNECYDYYRITRYGHRSSFGYEHFVTDHLRYYTNYDRGYDDGYGDGFVDGRYYEQYYNNLYHRPYNNYGIYVR